MDALNIINYVISIIFILCYSYQFFYILVPVFKKERPHRSEQGHDYAVLISARNEQAVIGNLLDSIARQTYERGSVTVFVVADNCTDDTARVASEHGAVVFERFDTSRVGKGYANKLEAHGMYTMGDVARCSIGKDTDYYNEELLYQLFGINAEILIDHAWGWEPCTIADVKAYKPENKSIVSGQVLQCPYDFDKARLVAREMADALALDLVDKGLATNQLVLTVGYDRENLDDPNHAARYRGSVVTDRYGRKIPKPATGTENFPYTSSTSRLLQAVTALYDRIVDPNLLIRRLSISANKLLPEADAPKDEAEQLDLFTDYAAKERREQADEAAHARERKIQEAMLGIKKKYGKNAILKGMNLEEGATARERNETIGGHHA